MTAPLLAARLTAWVPAEVDVVNHLRLLAESPAGRQKQPTSKDDLPEVGARDLGILPLPSLWRISPSARSREASATSAVHPAVFEASRCVHLPPPCCSQSRTVHVVRPAAASRRIRCS